MRPSTATKRISRLLIVCWIILVILTFILGAVGFLYQPFPKGQELTWGDAPYRAFQLFIGAGGDIHEPVWQIQLARWLAPLLTATGLLRWIVSLQPASTKPLVLSNHVVICGLGKMGRRFAQQYHSQGKQVVILERDRTNSAIPGFRGAGMVVLEGDAAKLGMLEQAKVNDAAIVLALADDATNFRIRQGLTGLVKPSTRDPVKGALRFFMHVLDEGHLARVRLEALRAGSARYDFRRSASSLSPLEVDAFNIYEVAANLLLNIKGHRFFAPGTIKSPLRQLAFAGWDRWNQGMLIQAVRRWRRSNAWKKNKEKLSVVIAHDDVAKLEQQWQPFFRAHKALEETCSIATTTIADMRARLNAETLLFVSMYRDAETLVQAQSLCPESAPLPCPVVVVFKESWKFNKALLPPRDKLHVYWVQNQACMPDYLVSTCEQLGRAIHEQYLRDRVEAGVEMQSRPAMKPWATLDEIFRSSNIRQAASMEDNVAQAGYELRSMEDAELATFDLADPELEPIARREHDRYVQERQWLDPKAPTESWAGLDAKYKQITRDQVQAWPRILALVGFALHKREGEGKVKTAAKA